MRSGNLHFKEQLRWLTQGVCRPQGDRRRLKVSSSHCVYSEQPALIPPPPSPPRPPAPPPPPKRGDGPSQPGKSLAGAVRPLTVLTVRGAWTPLPPLAAQTPGLKINGGFIGSSVSPTTRPRHWHPVCSCTIGGPTPLLWTPSNRNADPSLGKVL